MKWVAVMSLFMYCPGPGCSEPEPYIPEPAPGQCELLFDQWEAMIRGADACEVDADCVPVGGPETCQDTSWISRNCGEAVNYELYEQTTAEAVETVFLDTFACSFATTDGCSIPVGASCVAGHCRATEWLSCVDPPFCEPVSQLGCAANEKCAWVGSTEDGPSATCVPCDEDGVNCGAQTGDECEVFAAGYDNCAAGSYCRDSRCATMCNIYDDTTCGGAGVCARDDSFAGYPAGICLAPCDPDQPSCPGDGDECWVTEAAGGQGVCMPAPF